MKKPILILIFTFMLAAMSANAQRVGLKTNALYWASATPNIGVELSLGRKMTLDISGGFHPWDFGKYDETKKMKHWLIKPELRFWPYEKWDGHFLGIHGLMASYNTGGIDIPLFPISNIRNFRYQGYGIGLGFSYGYQWFLGPHWNLELTAGLGYIYLNYERFECRRCGEMLERTHKHWFGPTGLGVSFIYLFRTKKNKP